MRANFFSCKPENKVFHSGETSHSIGPINFYIFVFTQSEPPPHHKGGLGVVKGSFPKYGCAGVEYKFLLENLE